MPTRRFPRSLAEIDSCTRPDRSSLLAARVVSALHSGIVALVLASWALPFPSLWWTVVVLAPVMQVQWWLADGVCVLTTIENRLRGNTLAGQLEQETFVGRLLRPAVGEISRATVDQACTALVWLIFSLCVLRIKLS